MSAGVTWATRPGRAGVKVLVEIPAPVVATPREVDLHDLIACPTCRARVTESCRTKSGHTTTPHGSRLVPQLCPCGATLEPRCVYCASCRAKRDQASKNDHARARRQAARARYA